MHILYFIVLFFGIHTSQEYIVNHLDSDSIVIDGQIEETWAKGVKLSAFTDQWYHKPCPSTQFRALWDDDNLYFLYEVEDPHLYLMEDSTLDIELEAVNSDRIEIFFRQSDLSRPYYALEMDAKARTFDSKGSFDKKIKVNREWDWPKDELILKSTIYENGYTVEGKISLKSLKALDLIEDDIIHAGLYRGDYTPTESNKPSIQWISWVKADFPRPNFHLPSSFGSLRLVK